MNLEGTKFFATKRKKSEIKKTREERESTTKGEVKR